MPHREVTGPLNQGDVAQEDDVRRSVNLETAEEELAVERFSKRPARNRIYPVRQRRLSRRTHGAESARNAGTAGRSYTLLASRAISPA